jgi:formamidopyrimidine-DNA glycosylase
MTFEVFSSFLTKKNSVLKPMLVGKDAIMLGIQNSAFQDIIYRAKLHPKRKTLDLSDNEQRALYNAIRNVIDDRLSKGGKDQFIDLYGVQGQYIPLMGPNMRDKKCNDCGTPIERLAHGGGHVHLCPKCQPLV